VVVLVCCAAPPHLDEPGVAARLAVLALGVGAFAASVGDPAAAAVTAAVAFLLFDGFVVDSAGVLAWHGRADAVRLAVLVTAALAGLTAQAIRNHVRSRPRRSDVGRPAASALPRPRAVRERERVREDAREVR